MFDKILVANRGEIACRIIASARRLGIATVAVYSDVDREALHVEMADEAVRVGPAPSAESYLLGERIVEACRTLGADAVHPGYGFLSENAGFARALETAGITFIGPPPGAIEAMGDKISSKKLAEKAGVNVIPGHAEAIADAGAAIEVAEGIGYPVMLKASAGGGGKGMRIAWTRDECAEGFERAASEARASFGDDRIFVEKFIERPRHIEIQVLADAHGNVLHLGERECSLQRRHQKVIEEAPSSFINAETRAHMGEQAVALARAVGYRSAGTVEFVVDPERRFYFLEMNTRLQVEHPVTEAVTGLDLVEMMIRVAAGEPLTIDQSEVRLDGWAMEARIYAEDPARGFVPSIGRLSSYRPPQGEGVRVDTGVFEGAEVSMYYDPMIAKLVAAGADRAEAAARLATALDAFHIRGPKHNVAFLTALARHPRFLAGDIDTGFIDAEFPDGFDPERVPDGDVDLLASVAAHVHHAYQRRARRIDPHFDPATATATAADYVVRWSGGSRALTYLPAGEHEARVRLGAVERELRSVWTVGQPLVDAAFDEMPVCAQVERDGIAYRLTHGGWSVRALVLSPRQAELHELMPVKAPPDLSRFLLSPMPGLLVRVSVVPGEAVEAGQELAVVEAMKMENVLRASAAGTVREVLAARGDSLSVDQRIIEFED